MIAETIDLVAVLAGRGSARRLAELARVEGLGPDGDYRISPAISETATTQEPGDPA
jgi:type IV secretion system protein VirB11